MANTAPRSDDEKVGFDKVVSPLASSPVTTTASDERKSSGSGNHSSFDSTYDERRRSNQLRSIRSIFRPRRRRSNVVTSPEQDLVPERIQTSDFDCHIVGWQSQDDELHPRNWSATRKWLLVWTVSGLCAASLGINFTIAAPGLEFMNADFHNESDTLSTMVISIYVLGYSIGPLLCSPLSEIYGRRPVLLITNLFLTAFTLGCSLSPSLATLVLFRFLSGAAGCASMALAGGIVADLFPVQRRGFANAMIMMGQMLGVVSGPIMGGFIAQRAGWRWGYWVQFIACGVLSVTHLIFGGESNAVVLIRRKTRRLRSSMGDDRLQSCYDQGKDPASLKTLPVLKAGIARPFRLLFLCPVLLITALQQSVIFGSFSLLVSTLAVLFIDTYGWDAEIAGLAYIAVGIGFIIGLTVVVRTSDATAIRLTKRNRGVYEPEMRLPPAIFFGLFPPLSFFWYGWSAHDAKCHWIFPVLALIPFGVGDMGVFCSVQTYFVDVAGEHAASASGAFLALRCLFAAFLPLAAPTQYARLGLGWGNSVLGLVNVLMVPIPWMVYKYGTRMRRRWPVDDGRVKGEKVEEEVEGG